MDHPAHGMHDGGAGIHRKGLADGFAANGEAGCQGGHQQGYHLGPGKVEIGKDLGGDGGRSAAGHDTADIAHHVIADGADPLGIAQQGDGLPGAGYLPGRHGMEGLFVSRGHRHTDDIENNTHQNDDQQDEKGDGHGAVLHENIRQQGNGAGNQNRDEKNGNDPAGRLLALLFGSARICFGQGTLLLQKMIKGDGGRQDKSYGLGRVVFHRTEPAVTGQAVSV